MSLRSTSLCQVVIFCSDDPSTISMIVLESGHYDQVRISPHPQECDWNLEAVNSMLPASTALPDGPTPLPQNQLQTP